MSYPPPGDPNNQPPQYPTNQPPQYQQPYAGGAGGYGYPPAPGGFDNYTAHIERPGTVTAASVITFVMSGIGFALAGVMVAFFGPMWSNIADDPDTYGLTASDIADYDDNHGVIAGVFAVLMILAVVAILLAIFVMRGSNGARIALVVVGAVTGLPIILTIFGILWTIAIAVSIILLFVGGANDWFRYQGEQRRQQT